MSAAARLAALLEEHGEPVRLLRPGLPEAEVAAKLFSGERLPLASGLSRRRWEAVLAAEAVSAEGWPAPQRGDRLVFSGGSALVEEVSPRRDRGVTLLYRLTLSS